MWSIEQAAQELLSGNPVVFPTETVYGIGARVSDLSAIQKIYDIKGRPSDNPLIVHILNLKQLDEMTRFVAPDIFPWIEKFWPGPLTLVLDKSDRVSAQVTAGLNTVALRMPAHSVARKLIELTGEPIAAPSANRSGRPSATSFANACTELSDRVKIILDGGSAQCGLESTVVDVSKKPYRILRPGTISFEELSAFVELKPHQHFNGDGPATSPGMKHKHYVPNCKVLALSAAEITETLKQNNNCGVISLTQKFDAAFNRFYAHNLNDYARDFYSNFFEAEKSGIDILLVETVNEEGVGKAIMDRLRRAAQG